MAFTEDEKAAIRQYLGYSELFRDVDTRLERQFDTIGTIRPAAEARVRDALTKLAANDARLEGAATDNLDLSVAEDVTFLGPEQIRALQDYGRSLIQRIAITFEVEPKADYYGASGAGAGGVIPLG